MNRIRKILTVIVLSTLVPNMLPAQELIAGDFIFERLDLFKYRITARLYYDSTEVVAPDSVVFVYDGIHFDTVGLASSSVLVGKNATRVEYLSERQFLGSGTHYIQLSGVDDTLGLKADNISYPNFALSTYLFDSQVNYPPFNTDVAKWDNDAIDYVIDANGDLRWYNRGYDLEQSIAYGGSNSLEFMESTGNYSKPTSDDSLLINRVTGEILWLSPSEPGKYLLGIELVEYFSNSNSPLNFFSRYLVVEIKPEDIVSSTSGAPAPLERALTLFPNPARDRVRIAVPPALASGPSELTIYNAAGARVYRRSFAGPPEGEALEIATQGWPAGVYSVAWRAGQGMYTARLVVDR